MSSFMDSQGNVTSVADEHDFQVEGQTDGRGGVWTRVDTDTSPSMDRLETNGPLPASELHFSRFEDGFDLRDSAPEAQFTISAPEPAAPAFAGTPAVSVIVLALRTLLALVGRGGRITRLHWNRLPAIQRWALSTLGLGVGSVLVQEVLGRFIGDAELAGAPGPEGGGGVSPFVGPVALNPNVNVLGPGMGEGMDGHLDIPGVHLGAHVIGSWNTNPANPELGVTFYRLSDGKLAVQSKKGRWKVWRPKKPIVLFADGAGDLKTMLRADAALNKQAKKIAAFLNRRGKTRTRTPKAAAAPHIIVDGHVSSR